MVPATPVSLTSRHTNLCSKLVVDVVESLKDASAMAMEQIDEMMLFEKLSAGMRSVDPQAVAIVPYLRDCMKPHLIPALAKSIEFTLDVAGGDGNAVGDNALAKIDPVKVGTASYVQNGTILYI